MYQVCHTITITISGVTQNNNNNTRCVTQRTRRSASRRTTTSSLARASPSRSVDTRRNAQPGESFLGEFVRKFGEIRQTRGMLFLKEKENNHREIAQQLESSGEELHNTASYTAIIHYKILTT